MNNYDGFSISVIDTTQETVEKTIAIPGGARYSFLSAGRYLFIEGFDTVTIVDTLLNTIAKTRAMRQLGVNQSSITHLPQAKKIYIHHPNNAHISIINTETFGFATAYIGYEIQ